MLLRHLDRNPLSNSRITNHDSAGGPGALMYHTQSKLAIPEYGDLRVIEKIDPHLCQETKLLAKFFPPQKLSHSRIMFWLDLQLNVASRNS